MIDISVVINSDTPIYPGDPQYSAKPIKIGGVNSRVNLTELTMGSHTGTHIDAPKHVFSTSKSVTDLNLDALWGPCYVLEVPTFSQEVIESLPKDTRRILLKVNFDLPKQRDWLEDYQGVPPEFARALLEYLNSKPLLIGIDALSIEEKHRKVLETHQLLLSQEIVILEGIDLSEVMEGNYELSALPLKLDNLDGSPVRAVLKKSGRRLPII